MIGVGVVCALGPLSAVYVLGRLALLLVIPGATILGIKAGLGVTPGLYTLPDKITSEGWPGGGS
jgi:hypothetical protein